MFHMRRDGETAYAMTTTTTTTTRTRRAPMPATADSPAAVLKRAQQAAARTRWEDQLWRDIRAAHLPEPARQYLFHPTRRYRADFCFIPERLLVEVQGGVWVAGRHTRAQGYEDDCRRTCDALEHGWRILPVTPDMVASGEAVARIERVLTAIWQETRRRHTRSGGAA